jgi:hypothetical protein
MNTLKFIKNNFLNSSVALSFSGADVLSSFVCYTLVVPPFCRIHTVSGDELENDDVFLTEVTVPQNGTWILTSFLLINFTFLKRQCTYSRLGIFTKCLHFLQHTRMVRQYLSSVSTFVLQQ